MAGVAAAGTGSSGGTAAGTSSGAASAGSARALSASAGGNQPAPPQQPAIAAYSGSSGTGLQDGGPQHGSPTLEGHADQIRSSISDVMGADNSSEESGGALTDESRREFTQFRRAVNAITSPVEFDHIDFEEQR